MKNNGLSILENVKMILNISLINYNIYFSNVLNINKSHIKVKYEKYGFFEITNDIKLNCPRNPFKLI